jgi:[ribosomal protein S18]-alanine N-acetyltransferase
MHLRHLHFFSKFQQFSKMNLVKYDKVNIVNMAIRSGGFKMYIFTKMTDEMAEEIAFQWKYEGDYSFYDMTADEEDLQEFLESDRAGYYLVKKEDDIIGYFSFEETGGEELEIGLGMKPGLTGKGMGLDFVTEGVRYALEQYPGRVPVLSVATFNERAIRVYEKAGFVRLGTFMQDTNGSTYEFLKMKYK